MSEPIHVQKLVESPLPPLGKPGIDRRQALRYFLKQYAFLFRRSMGLFGAAFGNSGRNRIKSASVALGFAKDAGLLPRISLKSLISPLPTCISLRQPLANEWNVTLQELITLSILVRHFQPQRLFEIGTFDGRTTVNLAAAAGKDARVVTLDLPPGTIEMPAGAVLGACFANSDVRPQITQLLGFSYGSDFSPWFNSMDFIFVDADHSYQAVINDSNLALKLLRNRRGVIVWHDYATLAGPTYALDDFYNSGGIWSGLKAIEDTSLVCLQLQ